MDAFTRQNIRELLGIQFERYCLRNNILIKKDEQNAFMVSDAEVLQQCLVAIDHIKLETNKRLLKLQKYASVKKSRNCTNYSIQRLRRKDKRNKQKQNGCNEIIGSELHICLYNTSSTLPVYTSSLKHILNSSKSGNEIFKLIMTQNVKEHVINDYEETMFLISPLLEQFKTQHRRFQYLAALKQLAVKQQINQNAKCKYEVTRKQLKAFFNIIFAKVVPLKIFGKLRNAKKIKKAFFNVLDIPCFTTYNLAPLINNLDINSVTWLSNIEDSIEKLIIITKFIKWFFVNFLIRTLQTYFHITSLSSTNYERVYIARFIWNKIQKKYIKKKICSHTLQQDVMYNEWNPPIGIYKLLPKYASVRPIFKPERDKFDERHIYIVFTFLKQLHATKYGSSSFQEKWKSIIKDKGNLETEKLYFVSCDIKDAFGSINQEKLYAIIQSFCENLPDILVLQYYVVKSKKFKDTVTCYKQIFSSAGLKLPFTAGTLYACSNQNCSTEVRKSWLLDKIMKYIFYQRVKINDKKYLITKGIAQGTMLSPILCDIYYNYMLHKEMASFIRAGEIIKYMDDILYITKDKISAECFLELTKVGIPEYNCIFQKHKTQSNLTCNGNMASNDITYIGYKINCITMEIEPKGINTDIRYITSFVNKGKLAPLLILKQRLNNIACLKITKFVLNMAVNSEIMIIKILKEKCLMQAVRASVLIKELFRNISKNVDSINKIIKDSNRRLARYVIKCLSFDKEIARSYMYAWNKRLLYILWNSYKTVFMKDKILKQYFRFMKYRTSK